MPCRPRMGRDRRMAGRETPIPWTEQIYLDHLDLLISVLSLRSMGPVYLAVIPGLFSSELQVCASPAAPGELNFVSWLQAGPLWRIRGDSSLKDFWAHSPILEGILGTLPALPKFVVVSQNAESSTRHIRVCSERISELEGKDCFFSPNSFV